MIALAKIAVVLLGDTLRLVVLLIRPGRSLIAENLFLRRQLGLDKERGVTPRRIDPATRISLALLSRLIDWRDALVVVRPETLIRWHRAGFRLFWRFKSRLGRLPIPMELRRSSRRIMSAPTVFVTKSSSFSWQLFEGFCPRPCAARERAHPVATKPRRHGHCGKPRLSSTSAPCFQIRAELAHELQQRAHPC